MIIVIALYFSQSSTKVYQSEKPINLKSLSILVNDNCQN